MLKTGLPYDLDEMDNIAENGAIVDMNKLDFPGIPENKKIRTAYIYLRNTDFDKIILDFSKVDYETKADFLLYYLNGDIENNDKIVLDSWLNILFNFNGIECQIPSVFNKEETQQFVKNNSDLIFKVSSILNSITAMLLYRFKEQHWNKDIKEEELGIQINVKNLAAILSSEEALGLFTRMDNKKYKLTYYTDLFSEKENDLFLSMTNSPLFVIMFGLCTTETNKLKNIIDICAGADC